jgi:hypothetical protein
MGIIIAAIFGLFTPISIFLGGFLSAVGGIFTGFGAFCTMGLTAIGGIFTSLAALIGELMTILQPWIAMMEGIQAIYYFFTSFLSQ